MQHLLCFLAAFLQICATAPFSVRLSGGPNLCIGRVEVFHRGEWGTVCDDEWDVLDAAVVCRELDCGEALSAPHGAWFGEGTGHIWLNEVRCQGSERHLHACRHKGFRKHVCTHEEDASAICSAQRFPPFTAFSPPPTVQENKMEVVRTTRPASSVPVEGSPAVRLVGGRSRCSGRVEVFHQGQWGTVCDDMWGLPDAGVVCRELGCGEALAAPGGALFGEGSDAIWLDDVQCQGGEPTLTECLTSLWGTHNCRHGEDAGAVCSGEMPLAMVEEYLAAPTMTARTQRPQSIAPRSAPRPTVPTRDRARSVAHEASWHTRKSSTERHPKAIPAGQWQVRLAGGSGSCAGRVEILHKDSWGTVCDDGWDLSDATVVCRELRCGSPLLSPGNARYGPGTGPIWLDDVNCTGKEFTLQHCQSQPWGQHNCNHHEDASVICTGTWKPLSFPKPTRDSSIAEMTTAARGPNLEEDSGLQNTLDETEVPTLGLPPAWEVEFPGMRHSGELSLATAQGMELEVETEEPQSPWHIKKTTAGQEILQDVNDTESPSRLKSMSAAHTHKPEPADPSVESQPLSTMSDLESERETEPTSPLGTVTIKQNLKSTVETEPFTQGDDIPSKPSVTSKTEPSSFFAKMPSTSAVRVVESARQTEPAGFSGTEILPVISDLKDKVEMVTEAPWDETFGLPPVTQGLTDPSAETPPASSMWDLESERETDPPSPPGKVTFRQDLKATDLEDAMETVTTVQWDDTFGLPPVTQGPTDPSAETPPVSAMWDLESERETDPLSPPNMVTFRQDLKATVESVPPTPWDMSSETPVTDKAETSSPSVETEPTAPVWVIESESETEPTGFSGTEFLLPDTQLATETMTRFQWEDTPRVPPATKEPTNAPAESQPTATVWVLESERETELATQGGTEGFLLSGSLGAMGRVEKQTATQNIQLTSGREETSPQAPDANGEEDRKHKEMLDGDLRTVRFTDLASTPDQNKVSETSSPSARVATAPTQLREPSTGCPVRQVPEEEPPNCCCSAGALGNVVQAMDGLSGELGSLSRAVQQQGSQMEAMARSLSELATSVRQLVEALPGRRSSVIKW